MTPTPAQQVRALAERAKRRVNYWREAVEDARLDSRISSDEDLAEATTEKAFAAEVETNLRAYADLLDRQARETCETCQYAGARYNTFAARECRRPQEDANWPSWARRLDRIVPLTINGRPFSCPGWTAKEPPQ